MIYIQSTYTSSPKFISTLCTQSSVHFSGGQQGWKTRRLIAALEPLTVSDLPEDWQLEGSNISHEQAQDVFATLPPIAQRAFRLYCQLKKKLNWQPIPPKELTTQFNTTFGIPVNVITLRANITLAQQKLGYTESDDFRLDTADKKRLDSTKALGKFSADFAELPQNWKPEPTTGETKKAVVKFKTLTPRDRLVFTVACQHPDMTLKEIVRYIKTQYQLDYSVCSISTALANARKALGLTKTQWKTRITIDKAAKKYRQIISKTLPSWPEPYTYSDISEAAKIWTKGKLPPYHKILIQTQAVMASETGKLPSNKTLAAKLSEMMQCDVTIASVNNTLRKVKKRFGLKDATKTEENEANSIALFNKTHGSTCIQLPQSIGVLTPQNKDPKGITERYELLRPLERVAMTALVDLTDRVGQKVKPGAVLSKMRSLCPTIPDIDNAKVTDTLSYARRKLKLPNVIKIKKKTDQLI